MILSESGTLYSSLNEESTLTWNSTKQKDLSNVIWSTKVSCKRLYTAWYLYIKLTNIYISFYIYNIYMYLPLGKYMCMHKHTRIHKLLRTTCRCNETIKGRTRKRRKAKVGRENHIFRCKLKSRSQLSLCVPSL